MQRQGVSKELPIWLVAEQPYEVPHPQDDGKEEPTAEWEEEARGEENVP